jgi:hypothetical protein
MTPTLTIITPTSGRATLDRTLASLTYQLEDGDELMVLRRDNVPWGNATRDEAIKRSAGSHLWWMDDDDIATDGALDTIRAAVELHPKSVHIFRMECGDGRSFWNGKELTFGNVGGTMCVVPNIPKKLGVWAHAGRFNAGLADGNGGDFHFLTGTLSLLGSDPIWHEDVIAKIRP